MTVQTALRQGTELLSDARVPAPRLTAEVLLSHALKQDRVWLYAHAGDELSQIAWIHYGRYLYERIDGKPTQYITRVQEFYGRPFLVSPAVLIPRPETEFVVETVLRLAPGARRIVDVGCGSGAIAVTLALELPRAAVYGCDVSTEALRVAGRNASALKADVGLWAGDLLSAARGASIDVIASNPPYVARQERDTLQREVRDFEPEIALYAGLTGNEIYARLVPEARRVLRPGGWLVVELGYRSLEPVRGFLGDDWRNIEVVSDLAGYPRVIAAQL